MNEPIPERILTKLVCAMKIFLNLEKLPVPRPLKLAKSIKNDQIFQNFAFFQQNFLRKYEWAYSGMDNDQTSMCNENIIKFGKIAGAQPPKIGKIH